MLPDEWQAFMSATPQWWNNRQFGTVTAGEMLARRRAKERERAARRIPQTIPIEYPDDPAAQAAFEAAYKNRLHMLRVTPL